MNISVYDKVKEAADAKHISIAEVERKAGLANGTISRWRTSSPRVESLRNVADALDTEMSDLIPREI